MKKTSYKDKAIGGLNKEHYEESSRLILHHYDLYKKRVLSTKEKETRSNKYRG